MNNRDELEANSTAKEDRDPRAISKPASTTSPRGQQDSPESKVKLEQDFCYSLLDLSAHDAPQSFVDAALRLLIELSCARRGIVSLRDSSLAEHAETIAIASDINESADVGFSRAVIAETLGTGETVLTSALLDPRFQDRGSVRAQSLDAVLCMPIGRSPILGVVYLQDRIDGGMFTVDDQRRVEAMARHMAPLAERLLMRNRQEKSLDATSGVRAQLRAEPMIGRSPALAAVLRRAALAAQVDANVILTGASGSGKTAMARIIHANSARSKRPFVELNCGTLKPDLVANELFGSAAGGHSTANRDRDGKVQAARGGTLFLDEVGDLPIETQVSLLHLLSERTYYQVGGTELKTADVRVIAATNQDLAAAVAEKRFREDLYYRLNVFPIQMPSLDERRGDLPLLANHFCQLAASRNNLPSLELTAGALAMIENTDWPGNVRELENAVEAAIIVAFGEGSDRVERRHFLRTATPSSDAEGNETYATAMRRFQHGFVLDALKRNHWNVRATAASIDVARAHLYNLLTTLGIKRPPAQQ